MNNIFLTIILIFAVNHVTFCQTLAHMLILKVKKNNCSLLKVTGILDLGSL